MPVSSSKTQDIRSHQNNGSTSTSNRKNIGKNKKTKNNYSSYDSSSSNQNLFGYVKAISMFNG